MDFGALNGLMSSENNKSNVISWGDSDHKTKWVGSGGGFCNQTSSVSAIAQDDISKTMLFQHHRSSNAAQHMLSFSLPNSQSYGVAGQFTPSQWMELEHQALIYKYITANATVPSNLLIPIRKALETAAFARGNFRQNTFGWGALHVGFGNGSDPEPGRCRRTDGKKWRCAKNAVGDQKYCERHINRGRHRSRKHVEAQNCHSLPPTTTVAAAKLTTGSAVLSHGIPGSKGASQDNRKANMEANVVSMLSSSPIPLKKSQFSKPEEQSTNTEFGLVCSDSLINPVHKSDAKSEHLLHQFMEDWPHSSQTTLSTTSERLDLSPVRMGLGVGKQEHRVPGGPLGEVLRHGTSNSPMGVTLKNG
ncbi:putative transcription factor interactor and regulator C3H-WRC/GRF family [Helianthus annuus]|nr:putative transcription factor interactor and regulator C3H-WRC/GRF family [Helianthus annuus]